MTMTEVDLVDDIFDSRLVRRPWMTKTEVDLVDDIFDTSLTVDLLVDLG